MGCVQHHHGECREPILAQRLQTRMNRRYDVNQYTRFREYLQADFAIVDGCVVRGLYVDER